MARRVGLPFITLNYLKAIVRPPDGSHSFANAEEKSEYACALIKEGLVAEGLKILSTVNPQEFPDALLYTCFGLFTRWDYESAEPKLKLYLKQNITNYQKLVGQTNLIAALVFLNKTDEAQYYLNDLLTKTSQIEYKLIHSYGLELSGQCQIEQKNYSKAEEFFMAAGNYSAQSSTSTPFMVRKWLAITELLKSSRHNLSKDINIYKIQNEAIKLNDWETVRSCDLHLAICTEDSELIQKVYFGTPHHKLRLKIKSKAHSFFQMPEYYNQIITNTDCVDLNSSRSFDIENAIEIESSTKLKQGFVLHRLLKVIAADFYKPIRANEIFSLVFTSEYFDPVVSVNRVHQAIKRLRIWLETHNIPIEITENQNTYKLTSPSKYILRWPQTHQSLTKDEYSNNVLKKHFTNQVFSTKEASRALQVSERTASRILKNAATDGLVEIHGSGPNTKYKFLLHTLSKAAA